MSATATLAPSATNRRASASPCPPAPPVISATRPSSRPAISDPQAVGQDAAMVRRVAEQQLVGLAPAEKQVGVVLPREPDPAVDLDVAPGHREGGLGAVRL